MKKFFLFVLAVLLLLLVIISINTLRFKSHQVNPEGKKRNFPVDTVAINHLSEAIKIPTYAYDEDDTANHLSEINSISSARSELISFLKNTYTLTFKTLDVKSINSYSLLLHWKSDGKSTKKPAILYAHLDVVPAGKQGYSPDWHFHPFSGETDKDFIYGRGAIDDKGSVIGILESVESLLKNGFVPSREIYIAFGHDEETGGETGAKMIAQQLEKDGVKAEFLLDEGGLVAVDMVPFVKRPVALIFTSEKGYLTLQLTVNGKGGHSSFPPAEPPVELLSKAIQKIHDHPFEKRMTESVQDFMDYTGPEMSMPFKALFANRWLFRPVIFNEYEKIPSANAMIHTTSVATVINGGVKENVVPSEVSAKINFRLLPGDSPDNVIQKVRELINDERITIKISGKSEEPSQVSSVSSESFKLLQKTIAEVFPDAVVAPSLLIAQTDSRHFRKVTENIYRFLPIRMDDKILDTMHGTDEKISIDSYMEAIEFYRALIKGL